MERLEILSLYAFAPFDLALARMLNAVMHSNIPDYAHIIHGNAIHGIDRSHKM